MTRLLDMTTTIDLDEFDPADDAARYTADDIQVTVAPGISVISGDLVGSWGVLSVQNGSTLINNGNILGAAGVVFQGDNATIVNNAGSSITGRFEGIFLDSDGVTVTNHGTVSGFLGPGVFFTSVTNDVVLNNDGTIHGRTVGIQVSSPDGGTVNNSGLVDSDHFGILVSTASGPITAITNFSGGAIEGTDGAIVTSSGGRISLDNRGTIDGIIDLNASVGNGNDMVVNRGKIVGPVFLGLGDDVFNGVAGTSGTVFGEDGNDTLIGSNTNNSLDGGAGNDTVRGGRGKDNLFGGDDRDIFDFNVVQDSVKGGKRDVIHDFFRGNNVTGDEIDLRGIDAKTGVAGNQKFKFIGKQDFHDKKGELRYEDKGNKVIVQGDVNGDGKADFEILVKVGALGAGDFFL